MHLICSRLSPCAGDYTHVGSPNLIDTHVYWLLSQEESDVGNSWTPTGRKHKDPSEETGRHMWNCCTCSRWNISEANSIWFVVVVLLFTFCSQEKSLLRTQWWNDLRALTSLCAHFGAHGNNDYNVQVSQNDDQLFPPFPISSRSPSNGFKRWGLWLRLR